MLSSLRANVINVIRKVHNCISFDLLELLFQRLWHWLCSDFGGFFTYSCVPWGSQHESSEMTSMSHDLSQHLSSCLYFFNLFQFHFFHQKEELFWISLYEILKIILWDKSVFMQVWKTVQKCEYTKKLLCSSSAGGTVIQFYLPHTNRCFLLCSVLV